MKVTKVELLWSRACHLTCAGCAMPNNLRDEPGGDHLGTPAQWALGAQRMRALGSQFVAIYGAEPLLRPQGLPEMVRAIYAAGMRATIITALPDTPRLKALLAETPLDSVTMSYSLYGQGDEGWQDKGERTRVSVFSRRLPVPDLAVVVTVTAENVESLPTIAREMTEQNVWTLFDLLHRSSGPASKCGHEGAIAPPPQDALRRVARELLALKRGGAMVHASEQYLTLLAERYDGEPRHLWHCVPGPAGWLTVDADGTVLACDDWQLRFPARIWEPFEESTLEAWLRAARCSCEGCAWNTHVDASLIEGGADLGTYIHSART